MTDILQQTCKTKTESLNICYSESEERSECCVISVSFRLNFTRKLFLPLKSVDFALCLVRSFFLRLVGVRVSSDEESISKCVLLCETSNDCLENT